MGDDVVDISSWGGELALDTVLRWKAAGKRKVIVGIGPDVDLARRQCLTVLSGGLDLEVYVYPYYEDDPVKYLDRVDQATAGLPVGFHWLDFEDTETLPVSELPGVTEWLVCDWIRRCMDAAAARWGADNVGLYTGAWWWPHTGNTTQFSGWPLWVPDYDGQANSQFAHFGGWTSCRLKQYAGTTSFCDFSVDLDFEEDDMDAKTLALLVRWAGLILSGNTEQAYMEIKYCRAAAGQPT
jgi:hypothetical protein